MDKVTELKPDTGTESRRQPRQAPRPGNLPRTIDPAIMFAPAMFGVVIFSMGFAAGAMWMAWWRS